MEARKDDERRQQQVPHLHVRGTHYQVGFAVGRTFKGLIEDFYQSYQSLEDELLPLYNSEDGRKVYDTSLALAQKRFPQYVQELRGISDGSKIPFEHIYFLHIESLMCAHEPDDIGPNGLKADEGCKGCTSLIMNGENQVLLGHTEDALKQIINNFYIVSAEIVSDDGDLLEKFTTLSYPGQLLGGTMGFNSYGVIHSVNSIFPKDVFPDRSPHLFLLRAVLRAKSLDEVVDIVRDEGCGSSDGFALNTIIIRNEEESPKAYNIEVCPGPANRSESEVSVEEIAKGDAYAHCNQYLRCKVPEKVWFTSSSYERHVTIQKYQAPYSMETFKTILSQEVDDGQDKVKYSIFKRALRPDDCFATVAVGIFDVLNRKWMLYTHAPASKDPVTVIPIELF